MILISAVAEQREQDTCREKNAAGPLAAPAASVGIAGPWRQGKTGAELVAGTGLEPVTFWL